MRERLRGVLVEGPDCAGKTTLVKKLKAAVAGRGWDVMQMGHRPGDQFKRYLKAYLEADRMLIDRGHFSEVVYSNIGRGGRHFAPWERAFLDEIVRREFISVLCIAPPDLLRTRQMARDYGRMGVAFENTLREHIADRSLVTAQAEFARTVAPNVTIVCETFKDADLDRAVDAVMERLATTPLLDPMETPAPRRDLVVVTGAPRQRTQCAARLAAGLPGWYRSELPCTAEPPLWSSLMVALLRMSSAICDGGSLMHAASSASPAPTEDELLTLYRYVASRGVIVACAPADDGADAAYVRPEPLLDRFGVPYVAVHGDRFDGVDAALAVVRGTADSLNTADTTALEPAFGHAL